MNRTQTRTATQRLARMALLTAAALALGWVEFYIPMPVGVHLGLANTVLLYALYLLDVKSAVVLMFLKVLLSGLTYRGVLGMFYSLGGGVLSLGMMILVKKLGRDRVSIIGVSVVGAVFHNMGQLLVASAIVGWKPMLIYAPFMLLMGLIMGVVTGMVGRYALHALEKTGAVPAGRKPEGDKTAPEGDDPTEGPKP